MMNRRSIWILTVVVINFLGSESKPSTPAPGSGGSPSLLDMLFPPRIDQGAKSNNQPVGPFGYDPSAGAASSSSSSSSKQRSLGGLGGLGAGGGAFSQITRLCETMAAANRAKKMGEAVRVAAAQPNDLMGWFQLIREVEPMPFETMACQMLERLIANPDEFVGDLMRMIMPQGGAGDLQLPFSQLGQRAAGQQLLITTSTTPTITPTSSPSSSQSDRREKENHKKH